MKKILVRSLWILFVVIGGIILLNLAAIKRVHRAMNLYNEDTIVHNFQNLAKYFPASHISSSQKPMPIVSELRYSLPEFFTTGDSSIQLEAFFDQTQHEGLMIIYRDTIVYEDYQRGLTPEMTHISWSMVKSVIATLVGIAVGEGLISIEEEITRYLPQFVNTAYDGVRIKEILQMSSGVAFNEDYGDFNSDINRFGRTFAAGGSMEAFAKTLKRGKKPGTYCHYVSIDTQMLGMLLVAVTGKSISDYYYEKLHNPMGMEDAAEFLIDKTGMEMALGGLNMTMRDYAKLGLLYLHKGHYNGVQIVDSAWIKASITPDAAHLMPGVQDNSSHDYGYGYQWWIPYPDDGDFFAAGIYNQYIYVQAARDLVIVKLSANHHFKTEGKLYKKLFISMLKQIAETFDFVPEQQKREEVH